MEPTVNQSRKVNEVAENPLPNTAENPVEPLVGEFESLFQSGRNSVDRT